MRFKDNLEDCKRDNSLPILSSLKTQQAILPGCIGNEGIKESDNRLSSEKVMTQLDSVVTI